MSTEGDKSKPVKQGLLCNLPYSLLRTLGRNYETTQMLVNRGQPK